MDEPQARPKRRYESTARAAAALETRRRIRAAAARLFVRDGYAATRMRAIAAEAGVGERTVFLAFPTKAALLAECIRVAIRGDDDATPLLERERWQAILDAPPERMLGLLADRSAELMARTARLQAAGESVGPDDHGLNEVRERARAAARADALDVAQAMARAGALSPGMPAEEAADVIYALAGNETLYLRFVEHRGQSVAAYARMLERALAGALRCPASQPTREVGR